MEIETITISGDYELYYSKEDKYHFVYSDEKLKVKQFSKSEGCGLRIIDDGKIGFSYFQNDPQSGIKNANNLARFSSKTNFRFPGKRKVPKLKTSDEEIAAMEELQMKDAVEEILGGIKNVDNKRVILEASKGEVRLKNSNGFDEGYDYTNFSCYVEAMKRDGFGYAYYSGLSKPEKLFAFGETAAQLANDMVGGKIPANGDYTVIFAQEAFHEILNFLLQSFSGDLKRKSATKIRKNEKLFSELFTLYDDPTVNGSGIRPFDDEGIPSEKRTIIDLGVVKDFLYDREVAALEGVSKEGFCTRSDFSSKPTIGHSNIVIKTGKCKNILQQFDKYIHIFSLHGIHTANLISGDFGLEVSIGNLIENGRKKPVKGFILSGNIFELFNSISEVGNEAYISDDMIAPLMAFDKVSVVS